MKPFNNIRVLDLSRLYPGPLCTLLLSDLGCEVIKIEDERGDNMRMYPPLHEDDTGIMYHALNRGKKSVVINLKSATGRQQFLGLVKTANVVVESFRPGVLEKLLEVDDVLAELHKYQPMLILARISAYGQNPPDSVKYIPAHDMNSVAHAGVLGLSRSAEDLDSSAMSPLPVQVADLLTGYTTALQISSALFEQRNTPNYIGKLIDVSMFDASLSSIIMPGSIALTLGTSNSVSGTDMLSGTLLCYDVYRAKSGLLSVGCLEPHFWKNFISILELPKEMSSPAYMFMQGSDKAQAKATIEQALQKHTAAEWEYIFTQNNKLNEKLPIIRVRQPEELVHEKLLELRQTITKGDANLRLIRPALDYTSFLANRPVDHTNQIASPLGADTNMILSRL